MGASINFTKHAIDELPVLNTRVEYRDMRIPELRLRVTPAGVKTFSVYKRVLGGKPVRITLGKYPALIPVRARSIALKYLSELSEGINPNEKRRRTAHSKLTLIEVYERYKKARKLKEKTLCGYDCVFNRHLSELHSLSLHDIDRAMVASLHSAIKSEGQADLTMRLLRAIYNFAKFEFSREDGSPIFSDNPVEILSHRKQWNNVGRKQTHLRPSELFTFYSALEEIRSGESVTGQSVCDAMLFALLTGLRRNEIFNLRWSDVDFQSRIYSIQDTKNGLPLELPLTPYTHNIMIRARDRIKTSYVFGAENSYGQIREPKKVVSKVKQLSNCHCDFHDLRRTFATTAEHLDIGTYKLKRMMNHSTGRDDVTAGYTVLTAETLRESAGKIHLFLEQRMATSNNVVDLVQANGAG